MNMTTVFTVTDSDADKPIVHAELVSSTLKNDQKSIEKIVGDWAEKSLELYDKQQIASEIEDLAYCMRKEGRAWFAERWCFELTELDGQQANANRMA